MEIPIPGKTVFILRQGPGSSRCTQTHPHGSQPDHHLVQTNKQSINLSIKTSRLGNIIQCTQNSSWSASINGFHHFYNALWINHIWISYSVYTYIYMSIYIDTTSNIPSYARTLASSVSVQRTWYAVGLQYGIFWSTERWLNLNVLLKQAAANKNDTFCSLLNYVWIWHRLGCFSVHKNSSYRHLQCKSRPSDHNDNKDLFTIEIQWPFN